MKMSLMLAITLLFAYPLQAMVTITTANNDANELKIKSDLESIHKEFDLSPWIYTTDVLVDAQARTPYSHPVLTMSTQPEYLDNKVKLLATYLHEQFHWHVVLNGKPSKEAFRARIKAYFPNVKTGYPYGSRDEGSTLSHLIVCYLEYIALSELIGQENALANVSTNGYYTWVYDTVTDPKNKDILDDLVSEFGLAWR